MSRLRVVAALLLLAAGLMLVGQPKPPEPPPTPTPAKRSTKYPLSPYEREVIRLTNLQRTSRGLRPLDVVPALMSDARAWSGVQASRGRMFHSKMGHGENVAYGQRTPQEVMTAWMNSPGHRRNILNSRYTQIGVGSVDNGRSIYWTQVFE
jgi:uncharacterized protein YkwD